MVDRGIDESLYEKTSAVRQGFLGVTMSGLCGLTRTLVFVVAVVVGWGVVVC